MKIIKIRRGLTFWGFSSTVGMIMAIAGIAFVVYFIIGNGEFIMLPLGILAFLIGLVLFISIRGVLINVEKGKIKPYLDIFIAKIGKWRSLENYNIITLHYTSESQTMNSRGNTSDILTRLFTITLSNGYNQEFTLKEFADYEEAVKFLDEYSIKLNFDKQDTYAILRQQIQERKMNVRK